MVQPNIVKLCECGCGLPVKCLRKDRGRYLRGHNIRANPPLKGKKFTDTHKQNISKALKGKQNFLGKRHTEEYKERMRKILLNRKFSEDSIRKMSGSHKGKKLSKEHIENIRKANTGENNAAKRPDVRKKISDAMKRRTWRNLKGEDSPCWKGGIKLSKAKTHAKRKMRGFILISVKNPYSERIEYHHIHPDLPYVVPCPARIHEMFPGNLPYHFDNVNAMLGVKFDLGEVKHINKEE